MITIKAFLAGFILFVYNEYIKEDWTIYKKWAKPIVYVGWFYHAIVIWIFSPIFIPEYLFKKSKLYKKIKRIQNSPEFKAQMSKMGSTFNFQI